MDRSKRITFDENAQLYAEAATPYPEALVTDILTLTGLPPDGRILEIGCGSGTATLLFARHGHAILAIELGEHLAALAIKNCQAYPKVRVLQAAFEDWHLEENAFDLAFAADAFHWIPPEIGYPKASRALKPAGWAAFFWRLPVDSQTPLSEDIDRLYQAYPEFTNPNKRFTADWLIPIIKENFARSGGFGEVTTRQYFWDEIETADQCIRGLRTFSMHHGLDEARRACLYAEIHRVITQAGGTITQPCSVMLFLAQVKK